MTRIENSTEIAATPEIVYDFFFDVDNFVSFFPGKVEIQKNYEGRPNIGDTFNLTGELAGQRMKSTLRYSDIVPNARVVLEQVNGDLKSFRQTIVFRKTNSGTLVTDTWEYEPPYSFLGRILDAVKMRKDLENYLVEGYRKAKESLEK